MGEGIPSVMPLKDLPAGSISVGSGDSEALNQKVAEVNSLKSKLSDKDRVIAELEKRLENSSSNSGDSDAAEQVAIYKKEVTGLQEKLKLKDDEIKAARAAAGSGGDTSELESRLEALSKERDDMRERLAEYEIIEEDLANLKRLQQENEQLKKELESLRGGKAAPAPAAKETEAEPEVEPEAQEEVEEVAEAQADDSSDDSSDSSEQDQADVNEFDNMISASGEASDDDTKPSGDDDDDDPKGGKGEQRSAEELLSEFEKMLG